MKQQGREEKQTIRTTTSDRLCSGSGLLLSVVCCIALIHVELRIQEHHRLISHSITSCDNMETKILRKVQQKYEGWKAMTSDPHWQMIKGMFTTERVIVQRVVTRQELVCKYFLCCVIHRFAIAIN